MKILVEFDVDPSDIETSRRDFHEGKPLSTAVIFADDLKECAYRLGGPLREV